MGPVNIYTVTRVRDEELFNIVEKHEAGVHDTHRIRIHEIDSLRILVDGLTGCGMTVSEADGFYFGFTIPQIGKEFDLLKVTDKHCLNIELKSQDVSEEAILAQLRKNRHYLTHLGKRVILFTVVTDTLTCYRLTLSDNLVRSDLREIADMLKKCDVPYDDDIGKSFRASEYLISPMNTPDKFIRGKYFLTPAQEYVKTELIRSIDSAESSAASDGDRRGSFFHITGRPGTGKTLLLYDLARTLSDSGNTVIIRCGELTEGERIISREISNLDIISANDLGISSDIGSYDFVLCDEAQRLSISAFEMICRSADAGGQICIFSSDPEAVLTKAEHGRNIPGRIHALPPDGEFELSERLRMNRELYHFILTLRNLGHKADKPYAYEDVSVNYANDIPEAVRLITYFRSKGYVFINACAPRHSAGEDGSDPFAELTEEFDVQHIIGREYDKVVMLMDSSFYYDENGYLKGVPEPDPDYIYPNLFYQGITRVREKLSLVVLDAPVLLRNILGIIGN